MLLNNRNSFLAVAAFGAVVGACNEPSQPAVVPIPVVGVKVTPQSLALLGVGDTATVHATIAPLDATDRALTWESTDSNIVRVDSVGHITAKALGVAVFITAITHDGHFQASTNVSVNP